MSQVDTTAFLPIIAEDDSVQSDTLAATGLLRMENHTLTPHDFLEDSYFAGSPYFHPELGIAQNGEIGNPVPYTLAGDDIIIGLLLGCFMFIMVALSVSRQTFSVRCGVSFIYLAVNPRLHQQRWNKTSKHYCSYRQRCWQDLLFMCVNVISLA